MKLILPQLPFRYYWYRKGFSFQGDLVLFENDGYFIIDIDRVDSVPVETRTPLAIYAEHEHKLHFTIPGLRLIKDQKINIPSSILLDGLSFLELVPPQTSENRL